LLSFYARQPTCRLRPARGAGAGDKSARITLATDAVPVNEGALVEWFAKRTVCALVAIGVTDRRTALHFAEVIRELVESHPTAEKVFHISPGNDLRSMWLAYQAHLANEVWNQSVPYWNKSQKREGLQRGRRSPHGAAIPETAPFLPLSGHVRVTSDRRSTLFNTDGQIFSDGGVPCVLFMENYDINRTGYHDTHDTMENIDLDYGAAVCAITIETVARAACSKDSLR
jgi:hypothetical protein